MTASERDARVEPFWNLARELMADPAVTPDTMMGLPCLRLDGAFFASLDLKTCDLVVKLPAARVAELVQTGSRVAPRRYHDIDAARALVETMVTRSTCGWQEVAPHEGAARSEQEGSYIVASHGVGQVQP